MFLINKNKCNLCGRCKNVCLLNCINIDDLSINMESCFKCYHCMAICPNGAIEFDGVVSNKINSYKIRSNDFKNFILSKRSHRNYLNKEVTKELLLELADLLRFSPTGTNSQNVYMTILSTRDKVKKLADMVMKYYMILSAIFLNIIFIPFLFIILGIKKTLKLNNLKKELKRYKDGEDILTFNVPSVFIFHAPKRISTPDQDCIIASTIGTIYAELKGLATCFNGFLVYGINANSKIKKYLEIPKDHKVYSAFLLGYPKYKFIREVIREEAKINII